MACSVLCAGVRSLNTLSTGDCPILLHPHTAPAPSLTQSRPGGSLSVAPGFCSEEPGSERPLRGAMLASSSPTCFCTLAGL